MTRSQTDLTIQRDRSALFITLADGSVRNTYTVKVHNKTFDPQLYTLDIEGLPASADAWIVGRSPERLGAIRLAAEADAVAEYTLLVAVPRQDLASASLDLEFEVTSEFGETVTHDTVFRGPEP